MGDGAVTATSVVPTEYHTAQVYAFDSECCVTLVVEHAARKKDGSSDFARTLKIEPDMVLALLKATASS